MNDLTQKKCVPCEGGMPAMSDEEARELLAQVLGWRLADKKITRQFKFKNFQETMKFVNQVAEIAEQEGHHPDMHVHWGSVELEFTTHTIGGLSENDFIMAAKVNSLSLDGRG